MNVHPAAAMFPPVDGQAFEDLCADIAEFGLRDPIVTFNGEILDGRARLAACKETGTPPRFVEWSPSGETDSPVSYSVSVNLHRRHLNEAQRSLIAATLATRRAGNPKVGSGEGLTRAEAATMLNVSEGNVEHARRVVTRGTPELVNKMKRGEIKTRPAARIAALPAGEQSAAIAGRIHAATASGATRAQAGSVPKDADRTLAIVIRGLLDELSARPREVQGMPKALRIGLVKEFAEALGVVPKTAPEQTLAGNTLAA